MAGIFHECGVPVLMQRFGDYAKKLNLESACCWPELATEDAQFHVDHCSIGYLVGRHWKLPDFVCVGDPLPPRPADRRGRRGIAL